MDKLIIRGGRPLYGEVKIAGAKNSALPIIAASILSGDKNIIENVPKLKDVETMCRLLKHLGASYSYENSRLNIDTSCINRYEAGYELVKTMRASILVLGPLLARYGRAKVSLPGGCAIGARPVNLHLIALKKMGANITLDSGYIIARSSKLKGTHIYFDTPTVTGTENIIMAASIADGTTIIENAAREPEVVDLANAINSMGGRVNGAGTPIIEVEGVGELRSLKHSIICDRIEAGTFMAAVGITTGSIILRNVKADYMDAIISKLSEAGINVEIEKGDVIKVESFKRPLPVDIKTRPYPGFPTDMQAQFMALMCIANGISIIKENIFENRFMHVAELRRMGADIEVEGSIAKVKGVKVLKGAPVMATDLRASASLILAALGAEGVSEVLRIYHLDRGYEHIEKKLSELGADIKRVKGNY